MEDVSARTNGGGGVPALPDDVHREIFLRLPARCLCRARAVCRSWRDLASEPRFLRAHAPPFLLAWSDTVTIRDGTRDCTVHLRIHQDHGRRSRCCDLRLVLTARYPSISGAMRSWDGILCVKMWVRPPPPPFVAEHVPCSYLLLNPITRACAVASAPTLRVGEPGGRLDRGYIAGAYSHPVTGVFHLLHSSMADCGGEQLTTTPRFRLLTVDSPGATWREVPMSGDAGTAMLQTVVGRLRLQSSATVHGRLHWRVARSQARPRHDKDEEELLVFHAAEEEFGRKALPRLHDAGAVKQQAVSTLEGKLCLLAGLAKPGMAVEVWVLEDYDAGEWRLRHLIHVATNRLSSPLHRVDVLDSALGNVGLLVGADEVEHIVFCNRSDKVYIVQPEPWVEPWDDLAVITPRQGLAVHEQSILPHSVIFGAMPRVRGIAFFDCPNNGGGAATTSS